MLRSRSAVARRSGHDQSGVGLLEILLVMFLLTLMTLAIIPALISSTRASSTNAGIAAATSFANSSLDAIRAEFPNDADASCADVRSKAQTDIADPAGSGLLGTVSVSDCPATYPGTVTVTAKIRRPPAAAPLAAIVTEILVGAE